MRGFDSLWLSGYEQRNAPVTRRAAPPDDAVPLEADLHDKIEAECIRRGWPYVHSRMDKKTTQLPGTPDFVIGASEKRTLWVECKSRTGKQTTEQKGFEMMLNRNGHEYHLISSFLEFLQIVPRGVPQQ